MAEEDEEEEWNEPAAPKGEETLEREMTAGEEAGTKLDEEDDEYEEEEKREDDDDVHADRV